MIFVDAINTIKTRRQSGFLLKVKKYDPCRLVAIKKHFTEFYRRKY